MTASRMSRTFPNVLLITTDSQRCDTLGCMGNRDAYSPHLDRLAAQGVTFMDAYTACPVCMPARCSLLTGTHTQTHGAIENGIEPLGYLKTFPTILKEASYTTIHVGKSHVGALHPVYDEECLIVGEKGDDRLDPYTAFLAEHGIKRGTGNTPLPPHLHMESFLVDQVISAISSALSGSTAPFFAHCSLLSPHAPLDPPKGWDTVFDDRTLPETNYIPGEMDSHPGLLRDVFRLRELSQAFHDPMGQLKTAAVDEHRRQYYGLAAFCDDQIGRLLSWLDEQGLRASTLVIFTSDHGVQMFDHGFDNKHCYYDASWRVPMIISQPGTLPAGETRGLASWVDIAPTILAAAAIECDTMEGFNLLTPLREGTAWPRTCATSTLYTSSAVVSAQWKYEWYAGDAHDRLFNRIDDPAEQMDLARSPEHHAIKTALHDALICWRAESTDVAGLQDRTHGGGPVAQNVAQCTMQIRGNDAEARLNTRIGQLQAGGTGLEEQPPWQ